MTHHAGQHEEACHLWLFVEVFTRDGLFAYRAYASDTATDEPPEIDVVSAFEFPSEIAAREAGVRRLDDEIAGS